MEEKSDFVDIIKIAFITAAILFVIDAWILPGIISSVIDNIFGRKKSSSCGCGKKEMPSVENTKQNQSKADQLRPQLKACLALEICGEDEVKMPVDRNKIREWKLLVMKNADKIFSKVPAGKGKSKNK